MCNGVEGVSFPEYLAVGGLVALPLGVGGHEIVRVVARGIRVVGGGVVDDFHVTVVVGTGVGVGKLVVALFGWHGHLGSWAWTLNTSTTPRRLYTHVCMASLEWIPTRGDEVEFDGCTVVIYKDSAKNEGHSC